MKRRYQFDAGIRAYRIHIKKWKAQKRYRNKPRTKDPAACSISYETSTQQARGQAPPPAPTLRLDTGPPRLSAPATSTPCPANSINPVQENLPGLIFPNALYAMPTAADVPIPSQSSLTLWSDAESPGTSTTSVSTPYSDEPINAVDEILLDLISQQSSTAFPDPLNTFYAESDAVGIPSQILITNPRQCHFCGATELFWSGHSLV